MFAGDIPEWVVQKARSSEVELQAQAWAQQHEQERKQAETQMHQYCQGLPATLAHTHVQIAEGNPSLTRNLVAAGFEVHTYPATEIGINGSGGPTCMARPIFREVGAAA